MLGSTCDVTGWWGYYSQVLYTGTLTLDGNGEMESVDISEEILYEEKQVIEDLIVAAHNNAKALLKTKTNEEISKATGEFGIPGFKWPL